MTTAEKLARFNLIFTFVWIALTAPSLLWWKDSILWVILISIWANIVGHFSAYLAARSEAAQSQGHNLTEADRQWLVAEMANITTCQHPVTTVITSTAKLRPE